MAEYYYEMDEDRLSKHYLSWSVHRPDNSIITYVLHREQIADLLVYHLNQETASLHEEIASLKVELEHSRETFAEYIQATMKDLKVD